MTGHTEVVVKDDIEFCSTNHDYVRGEPRKLRIVLLQGAKSDKKYCDTGDCLKVFLDGKEVVSFTRDFGAPELLVPESYEVMFEADDEHRGRERQSIRGYEVQKLKTARSALTNLREVLDEVDR